MSEAKLFLLNNIKKDIKEAIGVINEKEIKNVADAWMNDESNSKHRFKIIEKYLPKSKKILDMASGAGTFVYFGLLNGYEVYGIEPEQWKHIFNKMKAAEYGYPKEWQNNFIESIGETLPFKDNYFDVSSSYQTLEHVQDPKKCISEMVRVTKNEGGIHITCPDYRSTYEGHYNIAWLPLFPRVLANIYLKLRGKNPLYLTTLNYITSSKIKKYLIEISEEKNINLHIIDLNKEKFKEKLKKRNLFFLEGFYFVFNSLIYMKKLFRSEIQTNLLIIKKCKIE